MEWKNGALVVARSQELAHRALLQRVDHIGSDLDHGYEDESSQVKPRMRDDEIFARDHELAGQQQVQIEGPGTVLDLALAPSRVLDDAADIKQLGRAPGKVNLENGVDEPGITFRGSGSGSASINGLGAIETRATGDRDTSIEELGRSRTELGDGLAQVRTQSDIPVHGAIIR